MFRLIAFLLIVVSLSACSNSSKRRNTPYISQNPAMPFQFKPSLPIGSDGKPQTASVPIAKQLPVPSGNSSTVINTASPTTTTTVSDPTINAGINPNHGQPGHRCDIAVGAPLSSAPATATNTKVTSQPVVTTQPAPPVTAKATINAGINPNHGQPGHRCDIAVGAPLSSAPATANSASNTITASPAMSQNITLSANPVLPVVSPTNAADKNVKLNPAHGQPGHDCTIAVGQPLKK